MGVAAFRFDDYRSIYSGLFLERGMAVIPVSTTLMHRETVDEGLAGWDAGEAQSGHAVHRRWGADTVPVDRGRLRKPVRDRQSYCVAFAPAQSGCGNLAVDCGADHWPTGDFHGHRADLKLKLRPAQNGCRGRRKSAAHRRCGDERAGSGYPLNEAAAAYRAYGCVIVVGHRRPPPAGVIDWITYIPPSPCSTVKLTRVPGFTAC